MFSPDITVPLNYRQDFRLGHNPGTRYSTSALLRRNDTCDKGIMCCHPAKAVKSATINNTRPYNNTGPMIFTGGPAVTV